MTKQQMTIKVATLLINNKYEFTFIYGKFKVQMSNTHAWISVGDENKFHYVEIFDNDIIAYPKSTISMSDEKLVSHFSR